jgi:hypothetical protein
LVLELNTAKKLELSVCNTRLGYRLNLFSSAFIRVSQQCFGAWLYRMSDRTCIREVTAPEERLLVKFGVEIKVFSVVAPCSLVEVSEVHAVSIIKAIRAVIVLMMEAACTSETQVNLYQSTRRNNPEDSHQHIRRRENLKFCEFGAAFHCQISSTDSDYRPN